MNVTIDLETVAVRPGHWLCRLRRHRSARWIEVEQGTTPLADRSRWVWVAFCATCDQEQTQVHLVLPDQPARPDAVVLW